ncbi:MAG: TonB C-terminal domain-containing protein [Candidatus Obscuribacterales bacterium]|nr:TonB C-terminal domain-containing protein [Candidatus Obscuribacterales bacterium]
MAIMEEVLRVTDRFYNASDPDTLDRQSQLQQCLLVVLIVHVMMMVAFWKGYGMEKAHPRIIHDVDVAFEFSPPPPEPPPMAIEGVKGIGLSAGDQPNSGGSSAPKPLETDQLAMPSVKAPTEQVKPVPIPAKPVPSRQTNIAAPVMRTTSNPIKMAVLPTIKAAKTPTPPPVTTPTTSTAAPSGQVVPGGAKDGEAGGTGTGGTGTGGTGAGTGAGQGNGAGTGGGGITTNAQQLLASKAMGNIGPYRKDLLMRLAQNWKPQNPGQNIFVIIVIAPDGTVLSSAIDEEKSNANKKAYKEALKAVEETKFAPLPDWYRGKQLTFKIELSKVEAVTQ